LICDLERGLQPLACDPPFGRAFGHVPSGPPFWGGLWVMPNGHNPPGSFTGDAFGRAFGHLTLWFPFGGPLGDAFGHDPPQETTLRGLHRRCLRARLRALDPLVPLRGGLWVMPSGTILHRRQPSGAFTGDAFGHAFGYLTLRFPFGEALG
jgi:hypothetical protein